MPHARHRHIEELLLKKLTFAPVLAIQGARQVGKSFLARELLKHKLSKLYYVSLDRKSEREFAQQNPESFVNQHTEANPLVIDEAQKAPDIFEAIKFEVDNYRRPGKFVLLGSTEFSKFTKIRESLTGRMSRVRLFPFNLAETLNEKSKVVKSSLLISEKSRFNRAQLLRYLQCGGMPGIFAIRSDSERDSLYRDWLSLITERDILTFHGVKADSDLARDILNGIANLEEPSLQSLASSLRKDSRRIKTHLALLQQLFVIHSLKPHPLGTGKEVYFLCEPALARILGASFERQLWTWLVLEQLSQRAYMDDPEHSLFYYRSSKGSIIHLVVENKNNKLFALKIFPQERITSRDLNILRAFGEKTKNQAILCGLGAASQKHDNGNIKVYEWESLG